MTLITASLSHPTFFALTLVLLAEATVRAADSKVALDAEQEQSVRKAVYEGNSAIQFNMRTLQDTLWVPKPLVDLYRTHPRPVVELLLRIIDGADPVVSARAAGYAIELLEGPGVGVAGGSKGSGTVFGGILGPTPVREMVPDPNGTRLSFKLVPSTSCALGHVARSVTCAASAAV